MTSNKEAELRHSLEHLKHIYGDDESYCTTRLPESQVDSIMQLITTYIQQRELDARIDEWEQMHIKYPTAPYIPEFVWRKRLTQLKGEK